MEVYGQIIISPTRFCSYQNVTANASDTELYGTPSAPHSLAMSEHSATWVTISWQPPEYSHLHQIISYK